MSSFERVIYYTISDNAPPDGYARLAWRVFSLSDMEIMCSPEAVVYDPESHEAISRHRRTRARTSAASNSVDPNELSVSTDQLNLLVCSSACCPAVY